MSDIEPRESEELQVRGLGVMVNLSEPREVGIAIQDIQGLEAHLRECKRILKDALVSYWRRGGTAKTFAIGGGRTAVVSGGPEKSYDAYAIRTELVEAGMSEERAAEIVIEEITYTVKAVEANRAAKANPEYAKIIERNTTTIEKSYDVRIRRA